MRIFLFALLLGFYSQVNAQTFPSRPVRLIVGFTPGGGVDIAARTLAPRLSELIGQPVLIENKPGAGTNIANEFVAKSAADGHTLLVTTSALAINMALYRNLPFDALRDFAAVSIFSESPNVLVVNAKLPVANLGEFLAYARANPGKLNYSSAGSGTTQHLCAELFSLRTGISMTHIPYKGTAPSLTALIASEVDMTFANIPAILPHVNSGRLRPLASTGSKRAAMMMDVPTMKEAGVNGVQVTVWYGVLAPAATPPEVVAYLGRAVAVAARTPEIMKRLHEMGAEPVGTGPAEFARILRDEIATWAEVVKVSGARVD